MGIFDFLKLNRKSEQIKDFMSRGAVIIDVRTRGEFNTGHIKNSKNIPLSSLNTEVKKIQKLNKPIITCCQSGMRSASAKSILKSNGVEVINGGSWWGLQNKM